MKFSDFITDWKKFGRVNVGEGWRKTQDKILSIHIEPYIGNQFMSEINPMHISFVLEQSKLRGHSPRTTKHIYVLLHKIFDDAIHMAEAIKESPMRKKRHCPRIHRKERAFLHPERAWVMLEYVMGHQCAPAIWLQTLAGLRVSEAQGLEWVDVDFDNDQITLRRIYNRHTKKLQDFTKNGNQAMVPMCPPLKKYLLGLKNKTGFVCKNSEGEMFSHEALKSYLRRIRVKLNLPIKSSHELRHTCTEIWVSAGASAEDIRRLLNQNSLSSTKPYIHRTNERLMAISKQVIQKIKPAVA